MLTSLHLNKKQEGLYEIKNTFSLVSIHMPGDQAHNVKMAYSRHGMT